MKNQFRNNSYEYKKSAATEETNHFKGASVEVRNGDVNYALRKLKKILERDNWQKDLAKHEYYEKGSVERKRRKEAAKKRHQKEVTGQKLAGKWSVLRSNDLKFTKSKRKRRQRLDEQTLLQSQRRKNANNK